MAANSFIRVKRCANAVQDCAEEVQMVENKMDEQEVQVNRLPDDARTYFKPNRDQLKRRHEQSTLKYDTTVQEQKAMTRADTDWIKDRGRQHKGKGRQFKVLEGVDTLSPHFKPKVIEPNQLQIIVQEGRVRRTMPHKWRPPFGTNYQAIPIVQQICTVSNFSWK